MPNTFWGWGGEDDAIFLRLHRYFPILRFPDVVARYTMIKHARDTVPLLPPCPPPFATAPC